MVLDRLEEYGSVYKAAKAVGPRLNVSVESLRRWARDELVARSPEGKAALAESAQVKELRKRVRDLEEANEILRAASIFFAGELDPRRRG
jgi:transposase-like protein